MKKISAIIITMLMLVGIIFTMSSCGDDGNESNDGKQIPVYTGMSISSAEVNLTSYNGNGNNGNGNNGNNGNHYGHYKGDYDGKNEDVDEEDPFPENSADENIEKELESSLNVVGAAQDIYYAQPNEKIFITIHIDNPDNFEIISFTLNGQKYTNYMFEDGSDMENIILEYDVGNAHGVVEYTIDAIKYIDGTEIKDVLIEGNKTVKAGIRTENQVSAQITDLKVEFNKISFKANIKDNDGLVAFSGGKVLCGIYDGFNLVGTKELAIGENEVVFEGLNTNTLYQYGIIGYYNDLSGEGMVTKVLCLDALYTNAIVLFDDISVGKEDITFSLKWHNDHENKVLTSLKLYKGEEVVETLDIADLSVDGLLSANEYYLIAEYANGANTESIRLDFTTQAKAIPDVVIEQPTKTQTEIGFTITETDVDNVGAITKIELLHGEDTPVVATDLTVRAFTNLLSNNTYTVKVTYAYDLNDGNGEQTITKTLDITTEAKATPDVVIEQPTKTQTSLGFTITETDTDDICAITKIELLHGNDAPVVAESLDVREFTNLLSNNTYTVKVTYVYDLNDGNGEQTRYSTLDIKTEAKTEPLVDFDDFTVSKTSIKGDYSITDTDEIISSYKVEIYEGITLVCENINKEINYNNLDVFTDYTVKITYCFDLNDGQGLQTKSVEKNVKTDPHIDAKSFEALNDILQKGDIFYVQARLDNPSGITIKSMIINGKTFNVTSISTTEMVLAELKCDDFGLGEFALILEGIVAEIDGEPCTIVLDNIVSDTIYVNGPIEILSADYVDSQFNPIEWTFSGTDVYVLITFDNPTKYNIDSIECMGEMSTLHKIDDNHYYFEQSIYESSYWCYVNITSLSYSNNMISKTIGLNNIKDQIYIVSPENKVYIEDADDLLNIQGTCGYYELINDIDLSGINWQGKDFYGVFNGNGYSIKNMTYIGNKLNQNVELGLFSSVEGVVTNLNMENIFVAAELASSDDTSYIISYGAICAKLNNAIISNCTVDADSYAKIKNNSVVGSNHSKTYLGGLCGGVYDYDSPYVKFINCTNNGYLSGESTIGGICGRIADSSATVIFEKCTNNGEIEALLCLDSPFYAAIGGICGLCNDYTTITNCINYGNITETSSKDILSGPWIGGIAGGGLGNAVKCKIINCINYGKITSNHSPAGICGDMGGLISGCINYGDIIGKSYSASSGICYQNWNIIENCINYGNIIGDSGAAGICSYVSGGTITNCINNGDISGKGSVGGIVQHGGACTITNCINNGDISGEDKVGGISGVNGTITNCINNGDISGKGSVGGISGWYGTITNSYTLVAYDTDDALCTVDQLNSVEFYTETLGWSEDIWDLSDLDFENGKYPVLK